MGWKSNQVQRLSVGLLTLFIASLDASQNSVNQSIKKHQSTFENVAMDIWDLAEVGYQEYKSSEILINVLKRTDLKLQPEWLIFQLLLLLSIPMVVPLLGYWVNTMLCQE